MKIAKFSVSKISGFLYVHIPSTGIQFVSPLYAFLKYCIIIFVIKKL